MQKLQIIQKKWDSSLMATLMVAIFIAISCVKTVKPNVNADNSTPPLEVFGSFLDLKLENHNLFKINIPRQNLRQDVELELVNLSKKTIELTSKSNNIKDINSVATTDYVFFEKSKNNPEFVIFGQSVFIKVGQNWNEYSAVEYWKLIREYLKDKKIISTSTRLPDNNVLPKIPNYDPSAF